VRVWFALGVALLAVTASGCGGSDDGESTAPPPASGGLNDITGLDGFARSFESDSERAQLVLLLSPT
jgi:hypothetical protein